MPLTRTGVKLLPPAMESATPTPEADNTGNLAAAIALLAQKLTSPATQTIPKVKILEPDTFDGADPYQLRTFLLHCSLNFKECADAFSTDDAKVTYTLSFLTGSAMDCFEPYLHDPPQPPALAIQLRPFPRRTGV